MTRETKFGLLLVLTLTTTFGFLVWKRLHQPKDLVATTQTEQTPDGDNETPPSAAVGLLDDPEATTTPLAAIPTERATPRRPATPIEPVTDAPTRSEELFSARPAAIKTIRTRPKLPVDLDQQEFFGAPKASPNATTAETRTVSTEPDPFSATTETPAAKSPASVEPFAAPTEPITVPASTAAAGEPDPFGETSPITARTEPAVELEAAPGATNEPDPFGAATIEVPPREPPVIAEPVETTASFPREEPVATDIELPTDAVAAPTRRLEFDPEPAAENQFNNAAEAPVEITARSAAPPERSTFAAEVMDVEPSLTLPARTEPAQTLPTQQLAAKEPDPFFVEDSTPVPAQAIPTPRLASPTQTAAPVNEPDPFGTPAAIPEIPVRAEPVPFRMESTPIRTPQRHSAPMTFAGETYIVQPNDNFWTISKKVYGSGRYFEALAQYNAAVVPDPAKMKPGLKIATPAATELQSRFPKLLAAAGTQDTTQDPTSLGLPGDVYTAASGDNFWEISKRLYGDGKYFRALEQHNAAIVSDPQKLKPGMKLAAPKAAWLQAKYPRLIATAAPAVQELRQTQPERYQPDEPAGFFIGMGELPMYRVGTRDTLSEIAQTYLGRSSRWIQILEMNRDVLTDGNALNPGTVLKLPADASRVAVIEDGTLRR